MRIMIHLICVLSLTTVLSQRANEHSFQFNFRTGLNRMDFFSGPGVQWTQARLHAFFQLETGINKSFFQHTFYPRISLAFGYGLVHTNKLDLVPMLSQSNSFLEMANSYHRWSETNIGYRLSYGDSWKIFQESMVGMMQERFQNEVTKKDMISSNWSYFGSIGIAHVLDEKN